MNDVRKVVGDLIELARDAMRRDRPEDEMDVIANAERFLASLPADGDAWYPSYEEVRDRIGDAAEGCSIQDEVIRATADLIRDRGGQVGGEVVALQYRQKVQGTWSGWIECSKAAKEFYEANSGKDGYFEIETRELIVKPSHSPDDALSVPAIAEFCATLPESQHATFNALIAAAREVGAMKERQKPSHSPAVVAWRYVSRRGVEPEDHGWVDGVPTKAHKDFAWEMGGSIELAYSQPAAQVPAEVMEAAEYIANELEYFVDSPIQGHANTILQYIKSLQGAGHV